MGIFKSFLRLNLSLGFIAVFSTIGLLAMDEHKEELTPSSSMLSMSVSRFEEDLRGNSELITQQDSLGKTLSIQAIEEQNVLKNHLWVLIEKDDFAGLTNFLRQHPALVQEKRCGELPVFKAIKEKRFGVLKILREFKADLKDICVPMPLLAVAALNDDIPMMRYLARLKFISIYFQDSKKVWRSISGRAKQELFRIFEERCGGDYQIGLTNALLNQQQELIDYAISKKADINKHDSQGDTALTFGCTHASASMIAFILSQGADPNIADTTKNRTPLRWLLRMHEHSVEKSLAKKLTTAELLPCQFLLMCAGADSKKEDDYGQTSFYLLDFQKFTDEEKTLMRRVLLIDRSTSKEELKSILSDIYVFQMKEIDRMCNDDSPYDDDHFALWMAFKGGAIRKNLVARQERDPKERGAKLLVFNDIYKKYIE